MICAECKLGGELNGRGLLFIRQDDKARGESYLEAAEEKHVLCRGCDCQHVVGARLHAFPEDAA